MPNPSIRAVGDQLAVVAGCREIVLYRVTPGEGCILSGNCLLGHSGYSASGVAETDVTLVRLAPALFNELVAVSEDFRRFVFDMYGARLVEVMELMEEVAFHKVDTRLAKLSVQRGQWSWPRTRHWPTNWAACACS